MHKRCNAKTKEGGRCQNFAMNNGSGRCRMHGGKSKRGSDSPVYKHGLYSKYVKNELRDVLDKLDEIPDDDLIDPANEIKLLQALIISSQQLESHQRDLDDLSALSDVIHKLVLSKQRSQKILVEQDKLISVKEILNFLEWVEKQLAEYLGPEKAYEVIQKMKTYKLTD